MPQVGTAVGTVLDQAKLVNAKGEVIGSPPNFAVGIDATPGWCGSGEPAHARLRALGDASRRGRDRRRNGRTRASPRRRLASASSQQARVKQFKIVGLVKYGNVDSLGAATVAAFDLSTAQALFDKRGQVDMISIAGRPGVTPAAARNAVGAALAATSTKVQTASEADPFDFAGLKGFVTFIKVFLLGFAGIALFVGAFIIFNTFSITVAQRTREFALLRTIGASRRQVLRSVVLEAFLIGLAATAVGVGLGLLIAKFLSAVMKMVEIDLPQAGTVFALRTVLVSLLVGVVVTVRGRPDPRGAGDTRAARCGAPRGLGAPEVARVSCDAVHRDRPGRRRVRRAGVRHVRGRRRRVRARPRLRGRNARDVHRRRAARAAARSPDRLGRSARPQPASPAHRGASHARTRRAIRAVRP